MISNVSIFNSLTILCDDDMLQSEMQYALPQKKKRKKNQPKPESKIGNLILQKIQIYSCFSSKC